LSKITYLPAALERKEKELDEYKLVLMYRERELRIREIILEKRDRKTLFNFIIAFSLGFLISALLFLFYIANS
jgi:hypothetical protein